MLREGLDWMRNYLLDDLEMNTDNTHAGSDRQKRLLGPYFVHGPTLRRLGLGEDTKTEEHKQRGIMMRGCFRGNHSHTHGKRWPHDKGCNTPVYRLNHPPKRKGAICFCILPNDKIHP